MIKELISAVMICGALCAQQRPAQSSSADSWQALRFLVGTWESKTHGGSANAESSGTYTFQLELRDHVLARHAAPVACKGPAGFDCQHGDLLYIYQDAPGQPRKAIYFDNEGHVIHYTVTTPEPNMAVLLSDPAQPGPQFRLTYGLKGGVMEGKFQIRVPGQDDFRPYLEWGGAKK
ncbi:hypothetical protein [uncultured Paludibaculum sp.]|uniref:hypothetical protein n=1 Tax=uncultured Paludibaculum sp. TaxID=1765020 RepID=UPI002AAB3856|nr:hypothetical protein [uncultured Paludibaculum sp.]